MTPGPWIAVRIGGGSKWHLARPIAVTVARDQGARLTAACGRRGRLKTEGPPVEHTDELGADYCADCREVREG